MAGDPVCGYCATPGSANPTNDRLLDHGWHALFVPIDIVCGILAVVSWIDPFPLVIIVPIYLFGLASLVIQFFAPKRYRRRVGRSMGAYGRKRARERTRLTPAVSGGSPGADTAD